jgi:hypothetical protein
MVKAPPMTMVEMQEDWWLRLDAADGHGSLVARYFLPLEDCQPQNAKRYAPSWAVTKARTIVLQRMRIQHQRGKFPSKTLPGRPYVRCVRLSSVEPDKYSDWAKVAVDCLCRDTKRATGRLGLIHDDAPKFAEIDQQWREAKPGKGYCVIEVWSGANATQVEAAE